MTFEKLRVSVAVSLVLFIFIVGNLLAFGFLQKTDNDKSQNNLGPNTIFIDANKNNKDSVSSTATKTNEKDEKDKIPQTSQTKRRTIQIHRRTRAS